VAAVRKIGAWPVKCISSLASILNSFQCLGTLDGKTISKMGGEVSKMVVETFGGWEESAVAQLKKLGSALARHTGEEESEKIRHLYERLAILLVKGNAALFLNRLPNHPNHPSPLIDGSE